MAVLTRSNYIPNTLIQSAAVNLDFNQLVDLLSGVSTTKDALLKYSHATDPVLRVDQLGAGEILRLLQNGAVKTVFDNSGHLYIGEGVTDATPALGRINGTGGSGTDIAGANLIVVGGKGTGNAAPGLAAFQYPLTGASGATLQSLSAGVFPPWAQMHIRNDGDVVVSNTTSETSILGASQAGSTKVIEAGLARVGRIFLLRMWGSVGTTGTPTLQIRLKLGSTTIADLGAVTMANNTSNIGGFYLEAVMTVRSVGATGVLHVLPLRFNYTTTPGGAMNQASGAAAPTVDFTAAQTFDVTAQWSAASASNVINIGHSLIEISR